jgi:RHS repeat-associated protein
MKLPTAERSRTSFLGILRTPQGSTILIAVENMPIAPQVAPTVATGVDYDHPVESRESGEGVVAAGVIVETLDYYPYGSPRLDNKAGGYSGEKRKYIGQEYDSATSLSYLNARYYNSAQGQFISEDPVFNGAPKGQNLEDPQSLNAYSYAEDNPITNEDPSGKLSASQKAAISATFSQISQTLSSIQGFLTGAASAAGSTIASSPLNPFSIPVAHAPTSQASLVPQTYLSAAGPTNQAYNNGFNAGYDFGTKATQAGFAIGSILSGVGAVDLSIDASTIGAQGISADSLGSHVLARMSERGVTIEQINDTIQNGQSFEYFHDGAQKVGYYNPSSQIFVGQIKDSGNITTVITNATPQYIENLKNLPAGK